MRALLSRRTVIGVSAGLALGLLGPAAGLASAAPVTTVQTGDFNRTPEIEFNAFYPGHVTVTKGSTLTFVVVGFHTVTFPAKGAKPVPLIQATPTLNPVTNDPGGAPYWWGGVTPQQQFNPAAAAPGGGTAVTGRKTVNSGLPQGNAPKFTVSFPKLGTFKVRCLVHPNMRGSVTVAPRNSKAADTAARAKARAAKEKAAQLKTALATARKADKAAGADVLIAPGNAKAQVFAFFPAKKTVPAGTPVTFRMAGRNEVHTVTFGPAAFVGAVAKATFQGTSLALASEGFYPSDPPAAGPPAVTPTSHGNGYVNSGVLADPGTGIPAPKTFTVTFPTAGAYAYSCMVHPEMVGTITVS